MRFKKSRTPPAAPGPSPHRCSFSPSPTTRGRPSSLHQLDLQPLGNPRLAPRLVAHVHGVVLAVGPHAPGAEEPAPAADLVLAQLAVEDERRAVELEVGAQLLAHAVEVDLEGLLDVRGERDAGPGHDGDYPRRVTDAVPHIRPSASPIVRVLNHDVGEYHRWCTPSILTEQERIEDFYASDISISAGFFGTLVDHTGVFAEAEQFAAGAFGADRTMFSVHGSSGSNWIVLRMLALQRQDGLILVARNIHHSIINAIKAFSLDFRFMPAPYDARFEALLPPSVEDVTRALD